MPCLSGYEACPPPPPRPSPPPPALKVVREWEGIGVWPDAMAPPCCLCAFDHDKSEVGMQLSLLAEHRYISHGVVVCLVRFHATLAHRSLFVQFKTFACKICLIFCTFFIIFPAIYLASLQASQKFLGTKETVA